MAVSRNRLTARGVVATIKPGRHADGANLYLTVSATGAKSWVFFYRFGGRQREMGLGSAADVTLAEARVLAADCQRELKSGTDPLVSRRKTKNKTFGECADDYVTAKRPQWKSDHHASQWATTLTLHVGSLRSIPVDEITTDTILVALQPLWSKTPETASRIRGRIESVLDAARAKGLRSGDNPARWRGHLDQLLPRRQKLSRQHHAAMPYVDVPRFMGRLRESKGISALALEFAILTAARTGEVTDARWEELDLERGVWTIPAVRMKASQEHRVPIQGRAAEILTNLAELASSEFVFPGKRQGVALSRHSMEIPMRSPKVPFTVHGFRSSFRDWAAESTNFPSEVCEMALAHTITSRVEAAYRRGDLFEKRRELMAAWARFCDATEVGKVVPLGKHRAQ